MRPLLLVGRIIFRCGSPWYSFAANAVEAASSSAGSSPGGTRFDLISSASSEGLTTATCGASRRTTSLNCVTLHDHTWIGTTE